MDRSGLAWLHLCVKDETTPCIQPTELVYLVALLVGLAVLVVIAVQSRDLTTATLTLMPVAIAINIAAGAIVVALRLPIYLDSIGTVLVGALAGPWAGALTGLLANLIWAILPVPGGAGPTIAFFAPVAGVIGLLSGFWASQGVFRLRTDDPRVGRFLALWAGIAAAIIAFFVVKERIGIPSLSVEDPVQLADNQLRFILIALGLVALGLVVALVAARTIFGFRGGTARAGTYLVIASATTAGAIVFAVLRLLFAATGWFSTVTGVLPDGSPDPFLWGANLTGLAMPDDEGLYLVGAIAVAGALLVGWWATRGENARLFPVWIGGLTTGLVAAAMSAPIAAGPFGGVTGAGTDALVALFRSMGLSVFQSAFAQGLTSDPLDKTLSFTVVAAVLVALPITVRTMFSRGEAVVAD